MVVSNPLIHLRKGGTLRASLGDHVQDPLRYLDKTKVPPNPCLVFWHKRVTQAKLVNMSDLRLVPINHIGMIFRAIIITLSRSVSTRVES